MSARKNRITIRLGEGAAHLLMMNIDGWMDAGACEDGLTPSENRALRSAYNQISQQLQKRKQLRTPAPQPIERFEDGAREGMEKR